MCKKKTPTPLPDLVTVLEMENFGSEYQKNPPSLPAPTIEEFSTKWNDIADGLEKKVSPAILLSISLWAKEQMKGYTPPQGWLRKIPMHQVGMSEDKLSVLFFQETEQGFPLPSHSPIVFRRLMVAAVYNTNTKAIPKVYVTIRGWREE